MKALLYLAVPVLGLVLGACDPQQIADKAVARTAQSVIAPVVGPAAALCIVEAASPAELRAIAVDYGVEAGTTTIANINALARKPEAVACIAQSVMLR